MKAVVILSIIANVHWVGYGRKLARVIGIQLYVLFARTVTAKPRVMLVQVGVASWKAVLVVSAATERINALQPSRECDSFNLTVECMFPW